MPSLPSLAAQSRWELCSRSVQRTYNTPMGKSTSVRGGTHFARAAHTIPRGCATSLRRVARELRPEALDDLGLPSALAALSERLARQAGLHVEHQLQPVLPPRCPPRRTSWSIASRKRQSPTCCGTPAA